MNQPRFKAVTVHSGATQDIRRGQSVWYVLDSAYCYREVTHFGDNLESDTPENAARRLAARLEQEHRTHMEEQ